MKWSLHWPLHAAADFTERDAAPAPKAWWLGWLKLLCAWLLCMLLCANIALALAEKLPASGCRMAPSAAAPEAGIAKLLRNTEKQVLQCGGSK